MAPVIATTSRRAGAPAGLLSAILQQGLQFAGFEHLVHYILRLRQKIETDPTNPTFIRSVRGFGYSFNEMPANETAPAGRSG